MRDLVFGESQIRNPELWESDRKYKCGGCRKEFYRYKLTPVKYPNNKQILRCPECMKKYRRRI
jgi:DNA-directed RNA polymerase subunit RPC12/RpoP